MQKEFSQCYLGLHSYNTKQDVELFKVGPKSFRFLNLCLKNLVYEINIKYILPKYIVFDLHHLIDQT